mgnify:CR=1 FL=1
MQQYLNDYHNVIYRTILIRKSLLVLYSIIYLISLSYILYIHNINDIYNTNYNTNYEYYYNLIAKTILLISFLLYFLAHFVNKWKNSNTFNKYAHDIFIVKNNSIIINNTQFKIYLNNNSLLYEKNNCRRELYNNLITGKSLPHVNSYINYIDTSYDEENKINNLILLMPYEDYNWTVYVNTFLLLADYPTYKLTNYKPIKLCCLLLFVIK